MSSLALSVALVPQREWITPEEQLDRLRYNLPVAKEVARVAGMIKELAALVGEYTSDEGLLHWYVALACLHKLPQQLPALPLDFVQMFCGACPIFNKDRTISDTHALMLIPQELGDPQVPEAPGAFPQPRGIDGLVANVLQPLYREARPDRAVLANHLQLIEVIDHHDYRRHKSAPFGVTHWVLMTTDVIPGSRTETYSQQVQRVTDLAASTGFSYKVPSFQSAIAVIFLYRVATGISLYQEGNDQNNNEFTFTRVQETLVKWPLAVGGFAPGGLRIPSSLCPTNRIGIAVLLKF